MASKYTQETRLLKLYTPLGEDLLKAIYIGGQEGISEIYQFEIHAWAGVDEEVEFADIIGQPVSMRATLDEEGERWFHGIARSITRDRYNLHTITYRIEMVPKLWTLTQRTQSRIFQQLTIPDILKKVFAGLDMVWRLTGQYEPRDYCVQYKESDYDFASRLMAEEGIYYYFKHSDEKHEMIVADTPQGHDELEFKNEIPFDDEIGNPGDLETIRQWTKTQELRPGKVTLWDHCFELPHKNLETSVKVNAPLTIGKVQHKLNAGANEALEIYEYPGEYAQRFDGIAPGGGEQSDRIGKIQGDGERTSRIRIEEEAAQMIRMRGETQYLNMTPGFKFNLTGHFSDDDEYVITTVSHSISEQGGYGMESSEIVVDRHVSFTCIPLALPFRPKRLASKPRIHGTQVALVTGPAGEEIFTDKYGRIKVQFFWDRQGQFDGGSSCWVRVATPWAGNNWGMVHIPRIGQEVVIAFEEGDPDQPMAVGSVYNAHEMPPHALPDNKTWSGIKSRSTPGAGAQNLNEIRFEDKIGSEYIFIHGEKDVHFRCKDSYFGNIDGSFNETIGGDSATSIGGKKGVTVKGHYAIKTDSDMIIAAQGHGRFFANGFMYVKGTTGTRVQSDSTVHVKGADIKIDSAGAVEISAPSGIGLKCGSNSVTINSGGVFITGSMVNINTVSGSAHQARRGFEARRDQTDRKQSGPERRRKHARRERRREQGQDALDRSQARR